MALMRTARLKVPVDWPVGYYHCLSRVVDRRFIFDVEEKEQFVALMREYEEFCEVRVLTYCLMSNHFHILLEVPCRPAPEALPSPERVLAKLAKLTGHQNVGLVRQRFEMYRQADDAAGLAKYLGSFHDRLWNVSEFIKLLKMRFSAWYNTRMGRKGTLWEERFKSVLVEGAGEALVTMAAYIDLNPVRAGLVEDPKDYRWSGYGEAVAGQRKAKLGVQTLVTALQRGQAEESVSRALEVYRTWVFMEGHEERESIDEQGRPARGAIRREAVLEVLQSKGRLSLPEYLRCRVRYFSDGAVLGGREFVDGVFAAHRKRFGPKRTSGARRLKGLEEESGLFALRDLRVDVFG